MKSKIERATKSLNEALLQLPSSEIPNLMMT
jgi:hypothetical protein